MYDAAMGEFWDARAAEDAFFFVDNRLAYRRPDMERFWAGGREVVELTLELLEVEIASTDAIVEIGCGVGRITRALAERGNHVRALDVSQRMLDLAREHNSHLDNVEWIFGDGRSLSAIESASADVCHSHVVFQHVPDPRITLGYVTEMGRVLRPGGWAAIQVSNNPSIHRRRSLPARVGMRLRALIGRAPSGQDHPAWRGSSVDLADLRDTAAQAEMTVERVVGAGTLHCLVLLRKQPTP